MPSSHTENLLRLYEDDLKDIYWAEKHLLKVLPKMAKASSSEELKQALDDHLAQTEHHVTRLEKVFAASGLVAGSKKCEGIEGLTKEGERVIEAHEKGSVRDAGIIISAQKVEHYEIVAYGSLRTLAYVMDLDGAAKILQDTLDEESESDRILTNLSGTINAQAYLDQPEMMVEE